MKSGGYEEADRRAKTMPDDLNVPDRFGRNGSGGFLERAEKGSEDLGASLCRDWWRLNKIEKSEKSRRPMSLESGNVRVVNTGREDMGLILGWEEVRRKGNEQVVVACRVDVTGCE